MSDPAAMAVSRTMAFDGSYVSARLTGSTVRLVSSDYPWAGSAESGHGRALVPRMSSAIRRAAGSGAAGSLAVTTCGDRRDSPARACSRC